LKQTKKIGLPPSDLKGKDFEGHAPTGRKNATGNMILEPVNYSHASGLLTIHVG
jgi:hypothetical protein